jgi:hypothetical protein
VDLACERRRRDAAGEPRLGDKLLEDLQQQCLAARLLGRGDRQIRGDPERVDRVRVHRPESNGRRLLGAQHDVAANERNDIIEELAGGTLRAHAGTSKLKGAAAPLR